MKDLFEMALLLHFGQLFRYAPDQTIHRLRITTVKGIRYRLVLSNLMLINLITPSKT